MSSRLRPVHEFSAQIGRRHPTNLSAAGDAGLPVELALSLRSSTSSLPACAPSMLNRRLPTAHSAHELRTPIAGSLAQTQRLIAELETSTAWGPRAANRNVAATPQASIRDIAAVVARRSRHRLDGRGREPAARVAIAGGGSEMVSHHPLPSAPGPTRKARDLALLSSKPCCGRGRWTP